MNSDDGADFPSIREGRLSTIAGYPKELMVLMRTLTQKEPSCRPSAERLSLLLPVSMLYCFLSRLLKNPALDPSAIKSMSQLKRELKEEREKVL